MPLRVSNLRLGIDESELALREHLARALVLVGFLADVRQIVRRSFPVECFEPRQTNEWKAARERIGRLASPSTASAG